MYMVLGEGGMPCAPPLPTSAPYPLRLVTATLFCLTQDACFKVAGLMVVQGRHPPPVRTRAGRGVCLLVGRGHGSAPV